MIALDAALCSRSRYLCRIDTGLNHVDTHLCLCSVVTKPGFDFKISLTTTAPSLPEFSAICEGRSNERRTYRRLVVSSALSPRSSPNLRYLYQRNASPGTILRRQPSSPVPHLQYDVSFFNSTSVAAPTLIIATPPATPRGVRSTFFIEFRRGVVEHRVDLVDARIDLFLVAFAFDDRRLSLFAITFRAPPIFKVVLSSFYQVLSNKRCRSQCDVFQHLFVSFTESEL